MPRKLQYRLRDSAVKLSSFLSIKKLILFQIILIVFLFQGCAFLSSRDKSERYFTQTDIENVMQNVDAQRDIVSEFYYTGKLTINGWVLDSSADIIIAAKKAPLMLKMEISHSWGKPLLYFLIKEGRLEIRDFTEKKQYIGDFTSDSLSNFLPNMNCPPEMIWAFLRGYPYFSSYDRVYEKSAGVLNIEASNKNILGAITFSPDKAIKEITAYPPGFLDIEFKDFTRIENIDYAEKTVMEDVKGRKDLTLKRNKIFFNKDIPDAIFTLKTNLILK